MEKTLKELNEIAKMGQLDELIWDEVSKTLAMALMDYLDRNRPEGKMCLSNMECEDIDKAFADMDFAKIRKYIDKYIVNSLLGRTEE